MRRFLPDTFVLVLFLTVCMASVWPVRGGAAAALSTLTTAAIVLLFFLHGARLPRENLSLALRHWKLHVTILSITFVIFPLLGLALSTAFPRLLPAELWVGVLFLCALPSTVQSSIAFTSIAGGNVAGTVASAAASNLIGIGLTPVIIAALTRAHATHISFSGIWNIVMVMLLPFALGHVLRPWVGPWAAKSKRLLSFTDRGTIVLAVYSAFSAAVIEHLWQQVPLTTFIVLVGVCAVLLASVLLIARFAARVLGFTREDEISIVFCGSKKSLVSGVPMARVLFAGPHVGAAILPLMIFHQLQLIVCAWIARHYSAGRISDTSSLPNEN